MSRKSLLWTRPEVTRRAGGWLLGFGIRAYGAGAALSVALSDAETASGKRDDAVAAVPNLLESYRETTYLIEHQAEIRTAVDYVSENTPEREELERTAQESQETLGSIESTYDEIVAARDDLSGSPFDWDVPGAVGHVQDAWSGRPDLGSLGELAGVVEQVGPVVDQVQVLLPVFYSPLLTLMDNFASDEVGDTLLVMGVALGLAWLLATGVGFWARRGLPGLLARALQWWGARLWPGWYARNFEHVLGDPVYAAARRRIHGDVVADPERELDAESFRALERWFAQRRADRS